ncbi:fatty acid--CoA ligase [Crenobacter sp. SG2303]|uniref:Fatty acid--CoA ligase n=1 Tax=Crenobacter oryzisoli TaxID=3056844 RepID=A0ABT7XNP0_9NEIS|nr:fatty acid--CoA ligase [Crenobacter sp. SG2303]MDN0075293.1 fatty acid--CoA ligase [Crenobacter sp. SG2303]
MQANTIPVTDSAYTYPLLIKQLLHTPLAVAPDQEIVYADKRRHTYREFARRINRLGHTLTRLGVQGGSTVAVMDWDSHRYLECFFSVPMLGAVLQMVNVRLSPDQILYTLNHAEADVLLVNRDFLPVLEEIKPKLTTVKTFVLLSDEDMSLPEGFTGEYESLLDACPDVFDFPDFDENTRATTFYTTGTTGLPKGVYFSHRQLVLHTLSVSNTLALSFKQGRLHRDDVYMPLTPMFHVHAWGLPYIATLAGIKQVYPGRYQPEAILKLIDKEKVSFTHSVPTILNMLLVAPDSHNVDLSGLKMIIGGSALTSALAKAALERGIDVFAGYGMSETCPVVALAQLSTEDLGEDDEVATRLCAGRPVSLVDLRTVDAKMDTCPRDGKTVGEVVVRAPWTTMGYLNNSDASEQLWSGGWLHTQDIGHIDPRGYLQITDRIKDVIKTGGEWVSSIEVEELICRHPAVAETAVIGVPDDKWGERPLALVVVRPEFVGKFSVEELRAHMLAFAEQGLISKYAVPERVVFVEELAKTSVGKLNKLALRTQYR